MDFSKLTEENFNGFESIKDLLPEEHQQLLGKAEEGIDYIKENQHLFGCNDDCKKNLKEQELYNKFINAEVSLEKAPDKLEEAEKNFITFKDGGLKYQKILESKNTKIANKNAKDLKDKFNDKINIIKLQLEAYKDQDIYTSNMEDLYNSYKEKIEETEKENTNIINNRNISNRNSYYDYQWIGFYKSVNSFIKKTFWIFFLIFTIIAVYYKKYNTRLFKISFPLFLILGFISSEWVVNIIRSVILYIYHLVILLF